MLDDTQTDLIDADERDAGLLFLTQIGDEELLKLLRTLPMVGANVDSKVTLTDLIYEMKLWPFVKEAWHDVPSTPGVAGRILQLNRVYKLAAERMFKLTGERRREERVIDIPSFLTIYASEGLP